MELDALESLIARESASRRGVWKAKLNGLKEVVAIVKRDAEIFGRATDAGARYGRERDELINRRNRGAASRKDCGDMNHMVDEGASYVRSMADVADMVEIGAATMKELRSQRTKMMGVRNMLTKMGNSLGISSSVMRIVQRRDVTDRYIVYGGIFVTIVVMYLCLR